jgi:hypothetical protein
MMMIHALAVAISRIGGGFLRRATEALSKLVPDETGSSDARRSAGTRASADWYRFPPF